MVTVSVPTREPPLSATGPPTVMVFGFGLPVEKFTAPPAMLTEARLVFVTGETRFTVPPVVVIELKLLSVTGVRKFSVPPDAVIAVPTFCTDPLKFVVPPLLAVPPAMF
jgi:hypothetical protein